MNRNVWLVGHALSMRGLIDAACQTRDVANLPDVPGHQPERRLRLAGKILDRLYYEDGSIDQYVWRELHRLLHGAE